MKKKETIDLLSKMRTRLNKRVHSLLKYRYNESSPVVLFSKMKRKPLSKISKTAAEVEIFNIKKLLSDPINKRDNIIKERKRVINSVNNMTGQKTLNARNFQKFQNYYDTNFDAETSDWYDFIDGWIMENEL